MRYASYLFFFCCFLLLLGTFNAFSQSEHIQIDPFDEKPLTNFIEEMEAKHKLHFFFKKEWIKDIYVENNSKEFLQIFLISELHDRGISVAFRSSNIILYLQKDYYFMDSEKIIQGAIVIGENKPFAPVNERISWKGRVVNGENGSSLSSVTITVENEETGAVSDSQGYFVLNLLPGIYQVNFSYVDYEPTELNVLMRNNGVLDVELFETSALLEEIVVKGESTDANISSTSMGRDRINISTIEKIPAFLGEVDIVKSLLLLPGVSTVGEGASGFNVRGGSSDQNLILFDGATVYNSSHLFGFFSSFNPDVVEKVTLYKGIVPAAFGDRISSVLDIDSKQLDHKDFRLNGGVGLVSSRMVTQIPVIIKDKSSILIGGRITYSDWILSKVNDLDIRKSKARFYDVNFKWVTDLGKNDKLTFSSYLSNDEFKFAADTLYSWQTKDAIFTWEHLFNNRFSSKISAAYVDYKYQVEGLQDIYSFKLKSGIEDYSFALDAFYSFNARHTLSAGGKYNHYQFFPGELEVDPFRSNVLPIFLQREQSREFAGYIQHEFALNHKLSFTAGLRYAQFQNLGPGKALVYDENKTKSEDSVVDTVFYRSNDVIADYGGFEPRFLMKYSLNGISSLKVGYSRIRQLIQVISNTAAITPVDIWKSSDPFIKPQVGDQVSLGYFLNLKNNKYETSVELYYKRLKDIVDYKNGAQILLNKNIEQELISGDGRSYGLELFLKKKTGRLTGWLSYTYSRSERKIQGPFKEEVINRGTYYPANFDQPHSFSLVTDYEITRRWSFGATFVFNSGRPVTAPETKFLIQGIPVAYFSERNEYRLPNYHRLDLSLTLKGGHKKKKILNGDWVLSVYNVYARQNAYSVYFKHEEGSPPQAYKLSILGTAFPSLTYNFEL